MRATIALITLALAVAACCPAVQQVPASGQPTAFVAEVHSVLVQERALELEAGGQGHLRATVTPATKITGAGGGSLALSDLAADHPHVYVIGTLRDGELSAEAIYILASE